MLNLPLDSQHSVRQATVSLSESSAPDPGRLNFVRNVDAQEM
jgi:hypothetical protein